MLLLIGRKVEDHPRLCGEKNTVERFQFHFVGSPPPMRGKEVQLSLVLSSCGITPAYAGKSFPKLAVFATATDHPRLCGEKPVGVWRSDLRLGSPPPMRGKVRRNFPTERDIGITPAYAGKSGLSI